MSVAAKSLQSCPTLCDPMDCSPPWNFPGKNTGVGLPYPTPGDLPDPGVELNTPSSPVPAGGFFTTAPPGKPICLQMRNGKSKQRWFSPNNTERMCQCICRAERPAAGPSPARGPPHTSNFSGHSEKSTRAGGGREFSFSRAILQLQSSYNPMAEVSLALVP